MSRITTASAWLAKVHEVDLPSGNVAGLRKVDALGMIGTDGKIPQVLEPMFNGGKPTGKQPSIDDSVQFAAFLNRITLASWVQPPIAPDGDARIAAGEAITLADVSTDDKLHVLMWNMGGEALINAAQTFLEAQSERVQPAPDGDDVRPAAE